MAEVALAEHWSRLLLVDVMHFFLTFQVASYSLFIGSSEYTSSTFLDQYGLDVIGNESFRIIHKVWLWSGSSVYKLWAHSPNWVSDTYGKKTKSEAHLVRQQKTEYDTVACFEGTFRWKGTKTQS